MDGVYPAERLVRFAEQMLLKLGLEADKATAVAEILVEGDLLGHTTHGLHLLGPYLKDLESGSMTKSGDPITRADLPAALSWDGRRLPGPWLVRRALELGVARARIYGTCTLSIRRSHHIACLAAFLRPVTAQGMMVILTCSDPWVKGVAPHGGRGDVITPNPIAAAWPTQNDPVILDVSMSITALGLARRVHREGGRMPGKWLIDASGRPTDDPAVLFAQPPGAILPVGGIDHGHKGFALGLLVEALTSGLAGHGRSDPEEGWGANVFAQVLNPAAFGGTADFIRQMTGLSDACHAVPPREGFDRVRLPGEGGLQRRREQLETGVRLYPGILDGLKPWAEKLGVALPG